ncbi:hypothetical protein [Moheibacter sediminis]|uniref:Uncharacterized protein n=1 Tax=Moheibacter sediminis TaxID=1434700 RepID=A0A1W1Z9G2_9FLAO|nr:hypothetical protein [Moheibacter sediminis]SMC45035.1 hypothetical protein SAMN06296427_102271 [Moheibacter sediminis]
MKSIVAAFILLGFSISFGQIYEFDKSVSIKNTSEIIENKYFNSLSFMNENERSYAFFVTDENNGVIRDEKNRMLHFFEFSNSQNNSYQFEYKYSIKMMNGKEFNKELYEITKNTETEFIIKKFRNERKKNIDYEFIVNIEKSDFNFLFVPFEKSIENSFQIVDLIGQELNTKENYQISFFEFKNCKSRMEILEVDKFRIALPNKLVIY